MFYYQKETDQVRAHNFVSGVRLLIVFVVFFKTVVILLLR